MPSPPSLQRKPTKKSSFLSLRREKKSLDGQFPSTSPNPTSSGRGRSGSHSPSPSSFHPIDFDAIVRSQISRPTQLLSPRPRSSSKSAGAPKDEPVLKRSSTRGGKEHRDDRPSKSVAAEETIDFPVVGDDVPWQDNEEARNPWSRPRSRTGPSGRHTDHVPFLSRPLNYPFRDSGSSSLSQFDPPPQTPVDDISFRESIFSIPVMVAAPVAGVETMDALVDGMNGYSGDDLFSELGFSSRSKISKSGYHPLYHPPLPTPPPGVVLGGALPRKASVRRRSSSSDDESGLLHSRRRSHRHKTHRPGSSRTASNSTVTKSAFRPQTHREDADSYDGSSPEEDTVKPIYTPAHPKVVPPSISEIIRAHAPPSQQLRTRQSLSSANSCTHSSGDHSTNHSHLELEPPDPAPTDEDTDIAARSSVDTIAEEVRTTIRNQARSSVIYPLPLRLPSSAPHGPPSLAHESLRSFPSPKSDGRRNSSLYSYSTISDQHALPPLDLSSLTKAPINSPSQTIAQYLRSSRLTTLLRLSRSPHASRETPLTVSLSDLGSPNGAPLIVFLGLGCVRHLMGLYDEMAECLGVRLITIDRWGLGRTDSPRSKAAKGIPEWASVVEEVLDRLRIDQCSVMAHSAGAPYALAFANRFPERIRGDVCLLAPWVGGGEGAGYKWLKYVPNGILKTAQAAEWKVQAWMLGKPPTIAYEGIGFDVKNSPLPSHVPLSPTGSPTTPTYDATHHLLTGEPEPRRSTSSGLFSDYDDLRDFEGRFESRSTLGRRSSGSQRSRTFSEAKRLSTSRKPSRGFLGRLKDGITAHANTSPEERLTNGPGKKLKALRSMSSLKGRSSTGHNPTTKRSASHAPSLPLPQRNTPEVGLGLNGLEWDGTVRPKSLPSHPGDSLILNGVSSVDITPELHTSPRANGRRSISFGPTRSPPPPVPPLPSPPLHTSDTGISYQAALGNALIAASHAESSKGTHGDLVQILNHDRQPWGFSYSAYPHRVRVWYGDRDERIAENVVRWMESTMGQDKCHVKVVKGADHALMFKSAVVVEIMEYIAECWQSDR